MNEEAAPARMHLQHVDGDPLEVSLGVNLQRDHVKALGRSRSGLGDDEMICINFGMDFFKDAFFFSLLR